MQTEPTARRIVLLGPQRLAPTLKGAVEELGVRGRVAAVTAGWEEREDEDQELSDHLGGRVHNLRLYRRLERVLEADPELRTGMQERYDRVRRIQRLYRLRLDHAMSAARELLNRVDGDEPLLEEVREEAIETVRRIDRQQVRHVHDVRAAFRERYRPDEREGVVREREALRGELEGCGALCIAGGHVAVLLNRLRSFQVVESSGAMPLFAWSAGAMVLAERVVLFHDSPPQGQGNAEVLEAGLAVAPCIVPLPHGRRRLRTDDPARVSLFARRFAPASCIVLDERARVDWDGERWVGRAEVRRLALDGGLIEVTPDAELCPS